MNSLSLKSVLGAFYCSVLYHESKRNEKDMPGMSLVGCKDTRQPRSSPIPTNFIQHHNIRISRIHQIGFAKSPICQTSGYTSEDQTHAATTSPSVQHTRFQPNVAGSTWMKSILFSVSRRAALRFIDLGVCGYLSACGIKSRRTIGKDGSHDCRRWMPTLIR